MAGIRCGVSSVGNGLDNAAAKRFFTTMKIACTDYTKPKTRDQARTLAIDLIGRSYDTRIQHSATGMVSPMGCEKEHAARRAAWKSPQTSGNS